MVRGFAQESKDKGSSTPWMENLFNELAAEKDVTVIRITKSLLQMMPDIAASVDVDNAKMNGVDIKKLSPKLDQIDIFVSKKPYTRERMREINKSLLNANLIKYPLTEVLMRIKTETSNVVFYGYKDLKDMFRSFVMFVDSEEECVLINLVGKFSVEDIKQVIDNNTKDNTKNKSKDK
jgi:hypothetical protein